MLSCWCPRKWPARLLNSQESWELFISSQMMSLHITLLVLNVTFFPQTLFRPRHYIVTGRMKAFPSTVRFLRVTAGIGSSYAMRGVALPNSVRGAYNSQPLFPTRHLCYILRRVTTSHRKYNVLLEIQNPTGHHRCFCQPASQLVSTQLHVLWQRRYIVMGFTDQCWFVGFKLQG